MCGGNLTQKDSKNMLCGENIRCFQIHQCPSSFLVDLNTILDIILLVSPALEVHI